MKIIKKLQSRIQGLTNAISRFPIAFLFLLAATITNSIHISTQTNDFPALFFTFLVGAFLGITLQVAYERFANKSRFRILIIVATLVLTLGNYLLTFSASERNMVIIIRTSIGLFSLFLAFIWIPVIKSNYNFNESFMAAFKALFNSLFFFGIVFAGISIILGTISLLLFEVNYKSYLHAANIIFIFFSPLYFLSLIPRYPGAFHKVDMKTDEEDEVISNAIHCPKFLEILISYILIPLITVFTMILILYLIQNIGDDFWTNNLLEPMIITYSITVLLLYILSSCLENKFAHYFRMIGPKVLVPIVILQVIATFMNLSSTGITHGRYFVIIYGVFSILAGILLSVLPVRKNGVIAALIILFSAISITPPIDAFSISQSSQLRILEQVLRNNNMLENNIIAPNTSLSGEDKEKIIKTTRYLYQTEYTDQIKWLPTDFNYYDNFNKTFGFNQSYYSTDIQQPVYLSLKQNTPIAISGYDQLVYATIYINGYDTEDKLCDLSKENKSFSLYATTTKAQSTLRLVDENNQELISFLIMDIFKNYQNNIEPKGELSLEQATFSKENDLAKITLIVQNLNIDSGSEQTFYNADLYILIQLK